ncbi:S8 family serine peptidase [Synechococcus sp. UW105]|uniref:S8 family serine peptidase n=1 Tax=Synechococcus sp. UW105 TaxID=337067 RepID=UPI000E0F10A4|nr:S8 family serine peptidase [Synechococcus sp. UW105]
MDNLFDLLSQRWHRQKSQHVLDQSQLKPPGDLISPTNKGGSSHEHFVFFDQADSSSLSERSAAALNSAGIEARPTQHFDAINGFSIQLTPLQAETLRQSPGIGSVEADRPMPLMPPVEVSPAEPRGFQNSLPAVQKPSRETFDTNRPLELSLERFWVENKVEQSEEQARQEQTSSISALPVYGNGTASTGEVLPYGVKAVWGGQDISKRGNAGNGTYAFVIDSGVLNTTGDLNINTSWSKSWISGESAFTDGNGHGTHVAGTIAALANGTGVVGVAPGAEVISLKVFNSSGGGASYTTIISAINHAVDIINNNGLDKTKTVINMSLGGGFSSGLDSAVKNAANQGIKFAIAAGNSGADADGYSPASAGDHANVYTVSAVDNQYQMSSWSNWDDASGGDDVDVAAPGVSVLSYYRGGNLSYLSGTSMAAPHVAGLLLMGGVKEGDMVKANWAGQSDPFALASNGQPPSNPPSPPPTPIKPPSGGLNDDFNGGKTESFWSSISLGSVNSNFTGRTNSLFFSGTGTRSATTKAIDLDQGATISFDLVYGTDYNGGEEVDAGEEIVLEYSSDGSSWKELKTYAISDSTRSWGSHTANLAANLTTDSIQLRWRQKTHSNSNWDQWAIDNINIKDTALPTYSEVAGKYFYGNGDYYFFSGTISSQYGGGAFSAGQKIHAGDNDDDAFGQANNETGNQGYYLITSSNNKTGNTNDSISIGDYYDSETKATIIPYANTAGTKGLGSESAYLTSRKTQADDLINNYYEADLPSYYWEVSGKYFYGNGDYYSFTGFINDEHTDGNLRTNLKIYAGTDTKDSFTSNLNELGLNGFYKLDYYKRRTGSIADGIKIISYHDSESQFNIRPYKVNPGLHGLGSESGWLTSTKNRHKDFFNYQEVADVSVITIESSGSIHLVKDSSGNLYAKNAASGALDDIIIGNRQVTTSTWQGWALAAADSINGTNQVINQNSDGDLSRWQLNSNWEFTGASFINYNSADYLKAESDFGIDFNQDGLTGTIATTAIESAGSIHLVKDSSGNLYAKNAASGALDDIIIGNRQVTTSTWQGWALAAADSINGTNQVINQNSDGDLSRWQLNSNWEFTGASFINYNSADYLKAESDFGIDFNQDGKISSINKFT